MAFPQGIDFRATAGFVTDTGSNYAELTQGNPSGNYPTTTPQGNTVGFVSSDTDHRDRQAGNDPRIAGTSFPVGGGPWSYRIDLPAAGSYDIFAGLGDGSYSATVNLIVLDNGAAVYTLGNVTTGAGNSFADISGAVSVAASWPSVGAEPSGNKITKTFASTIAQFTTTGGAVCHLFIQAAGVEVPWQNWGLGAWSVAASGTVASGAGTAAGSATVSGVSAAIKKAAGTSAGVGTATGHTAAIKKSAGSSAGVGSAIGHGASLAKSAGTSAGAATAAGVGKSLALSHGTAAGVATASGVGKSLAAAHGTAAGVATVSGHGASLAKSVGNAAGLATVAGVGTSVGGGSTGVAAGVATVSGHGASLFAAHGTAAGLATALGRSASIFAARGTSAGLATVSGVSPSAVVAGIQSISRRGRKPHLPMGFE